MLQTRKTKAPAFGVFLCGFLGAIAAAIFAYSAAVEAVRHL